MTGASGEGKSTLASLITRLHEPRRGCITLDGIDIATLNPSWLRRQVDTGDVIDMCEVLLTWPCLLEGMCHSEASMGCTCGKVEGDPVEMLLQPMFLSDIVLCCCANDTVSHEVYLGTCTYVSARGHVWPSQRKVSLQGVQALEERTNRWIHLTLSVATLFLLPLYYYYFVSPPTIEDVSTNRPTNPKRSRSVLTFMLVIRTNNVLILFRI